MADPTLEDRLRAWWRRWALGSQTLEAALQDLADEVAGRADPPEARRGRPAHFVSASCGGEVCRFGSGLNDTCEADATHKIEETVFHDDPHHVRHPMTAYLCCRHYELTMNTQCRRG